MEPLGEAVKEPIAIFLVAGRYLLFDIDVVTYLRKTYSICGVLIGGIPQVPQQNVFSGLPLELLPEEVSVLIEKGVAYVVEGTAWHVAKFSSLDRAGKKDFLESLRSRSRVVQNAAEENLQRKAKLGLTKHLERQKAFSAQKEAAHGDNAVEECLSVGEENGPTESLFDSALATTPQMPEERPLAYSITSTVTYGRPNRENDCLAQHVPKVPVSYPLFAHLNALRYFLTPGLRFGCDYTVYPGDPLRFHSHFLANGYGWEEDIPIMDIVGGGRLGTGVKKGFLLGGREDTSGGATEGSPVRTFCIEWAGM